MVVHGEREAACLGLDVRLVEDVAASLGVVQRLEVVLAEAGDDPLAADGGADVGGLGGLRAGGRREDVRRGHLQPQLFEQLAGGLRRRAGEAGRFHAVVAHRGHLADDRFEVFGRGFAEGVQLQCDWFGHGVAP